MKVLFVCWGNVARSQMAETYYNHYSASHNAISAGISGSCALKYINPTDDIVQIMREEGFDISKNEVKKVNEDRVNQVDKIYLLCNTEGVPEYILKNPKTIFLEIPDPYRHDIRYTRSVRDEIKEKVKEIIEGEIKKNIFNTTFK